MKANISCICRGDGKAYALFEVEGALDDSSLHASCSLMDGQPVVSQDIELLPENGRRQIVLSFPISPHKVRIRLSCSDTGTSREDRQLVDKVISPQYLKWVSRLQYRTNARQAHMIRDCEKDGALTRDEIQVVGLIPMGDEVACRCIVTMPNGKRGDYEVRVLDDSFHDTGISPIVTGISDIPKGLDSPCSKLVVVMSLELPSPGSDYSIVLRRDGSIAAFETISRQRSTDMLASYEVATQSVGSNPSYDRWFDLNRPSERELLAQSKIEYDYAPLITILVPLRDMPDDGFREMMESVLSQTYGNWELALVGIDPGEQLLASAREHAAKDKRVAVVEADEDVELTFGAIIECSAEADGYVAFLAQDDVLSPNALYEYVVALDWDRETDILYSDSDTMDEKGKHSNALIKPDFSKYLLRETNYIRSFFMVRASILREVGFDSSMLAPRDGRSLLLKCIERTERVCHCPKVLCSSRMTIAATSGIPCEASASDASRLAVEAHLRRVGIDAKVIASSDPEKLRIRYEVKGSPKVSIIIPTKDNREILNTCVESILARCSYPNFEIVLVENNSTAEETFENYEMLKAKDGRVRLLKWDGEFNFSKINNFGVEHADGDYLLFLNNDTEAISDDWLESMLGLCQQDDVGAVGAKLLYPDGAIQHGGVYVQGNAPGHININLARGAAGYLDTLFATREVSAVTGACLMCPKDAFEKVGGFDPDYGVAFNDVDLCMKIGATGLKVIFDPNSVLYHYESVSRGYENTKEKVFRFNRELALLRYRWSDQFTAGDPYMNVNLDPNNPYFNLPLIP